MHWSILPRTLKWRTTTSTMECYRTETILQLSPYPTTNISSRLVLSNQRQDELDHIGMLRYRHGLQISTPMGCCSFVEQNLSPTGTPQSSSGVEVPNRHNTQLAMGSSRHEVKIPTAILSSSRRFLHRFLDTSQRVSTITEVELKSPFTKFQSFIK